MGSVWQSHRKWFENFLVLHYLAAVEFCQLKIAKQRSPVLGTQSLGGAFTKNFCVIVVIEKQRLWSQILLRREYDNEFSFEMRSEKHNLIRRRRKTEVITKKYSSFFELRTIG